MWENIKRKWEQLFDGKTTEEERQLPTSATFSHQSIETKVTYKYPKTIKNFTERNNLTISPKNRYFQKRQEIKEETTEKKIEQKEEKKVHQPFKPYEVPSPVYGYRPLPKKEEIVFKQEKIFSKPKPINDKAESKELEQSSRKEVSSNQADIRIGEQKHTELKQEQPNIKYNPAASYKVDGRSEKQGKLEKRKKHIHKDRKPVKQTQQPINVLMTPRDKKNLLNRKQTQKPEKQAVPTHLFNDKATKHSNQSEWIKGQKETLQTTLRYFNIKAKVVDATQGPTVTRFEVQPEPGVKVSKIKNLSDDIKLNLAAKDIRMEAPIPGKTTIGIEVPNLEAEPVILQSILENKVFSEQPSPLTVALGADIEGKAIVTDINKMPHGLIAGATGSGKSVCINTILISLLYKADFDEVKLLLIDPKMVELTPYNDLPHLVAPVITDVKAATSSLKWAVQEMEDRYQKFVQEKTRDIKKFNDKMEQQGRTDEHLPYIVIVIDELADLMMSSPQEVEDAICRIAQKARACGIHLLIATQRPSVDVITGLIKANIPSRIAFSVSSQVDSRTILDTNGAEKLLGKGDMLFVENGSSEIKRIQGAFVSDEEIERITNYIKQQAEPQYLFEQEQLIQQIGFQEDSDELYEEAVEFVLEYNGASASLLQRKFKIGYNRAARLIDMMEDNGIVSGQNGSKQREVLISQHDLV